jgi:excisionase family DNA binding protein
MKRIAAGQLQAAPAARTYYTFQEAAQLLNCSPRTLMNRHFHKTGPEPTYVGKLVRFSRASLDAYLVAELAKRRAKGGGR